MYKIRNTFDNITNYIYCLFTNPALQKGLERKLQLVEVNHTKKIRSNK